MTPERWQHIRDVFDDALARTRDDRPAFVASACGADRSLRNEVESLLEAHEQAAGFIEASPNRVTPPLPRQDVREAHLSHVGAYALEEAIGRGGMGTVYKARRDDRAYRQAVAVKILNRGLDTDELVRRFRVERQILANLDHPAITKLLDGGSTPDGRPYFVMELVDGVPIDQYCAQNQLDLDARLSLFRDVCTAVQWAHRNLIVHRDLKPTNILVTPDGTPKLLDFGIAKLLTAEGAPSLVATDPGQTAMTPAYASPEQIRGQPVTTGSDVYALGLILFELLTGRRPYDVAGLRGETLVRLIDTTRIPRPSTVLLESTSTPEATTSEAATTGATIPEAPHLDTPPPHASPWSPRARPRIARRLRGDLDTIVLKALERDATDRYASVEQLANDLDAYRRGLPITARPDGMLYRVQKFARRHAVAVATASTILLVLIGLLVLLLAQRGMTLAQRDRAQAISTFVTELLANADPTRSRGEQITVREVLDLASNPETGRLPRQPAVRADLLDVLAQSYRGLGLYPRAERLLAESVALREDQGGDTPALAGSLRALGVVVAYQGDHARATTLIERAVRIQELALGLEHTETIDSRSRLGWVREKAGDLTGAAADQREALATARVVGDDDLLATVLDRLGSLLATLGQTDEADAMLREALAIRRAAGPSLDLATSLAANNLGLHRLSAARYDEAETLLEEAASIQRALFGERHPQLALTLSNLALLARGRGDHEAAERGLLEVIAMQREALGDAHPSLAASLTNLADVHQAQQRLDDAERGYRSALDMQRILLPAEHLDLGYSLNNLARVLVGHGDLEQARPLYDEALAIRERHLGSLHPETANIRTNLCQLERRGKRLDEARTHCEAAVEALRATRGDSHPDLAAALNALADVELDTGDLDRAATHYHASLAILEQLHGDAAIVAFARIKLARLEIRRTRFVEALTLAQRALDHLQTHRPEATVWVGWAHTCVGQSHLALGDAERAGDHLRTAIDLFGPHYASDSATMTEVAALLARADDEHTATRATASR